MGQVRFPPNPDAIWMYEKGGLSCREIAPMFGVSESTVKRWMRSAGVIRTDASKQGRPPEDECKRGHDLSKTRRRTPKGHPYCGACRRERDEEKAMAKKREEAGKMDPKTGRPIMPAGSCPTCGKPGGKCVPPNTKGH